MTSLKNVLFVNTASPSTNPDGSSWETAFQTIQSAVNNLVEFGGGDVWVARGVYDGPDDPVVTMATGVAIYGGFSGSETERDQRDWKNHVTIIDGQGTRCCVIGANNACLDGFTITAAEVGMFNGTSAAGVIKNCTFVNNRKGMYNMDCMPTVINCTFKNNKSECGADVFNNDAPDAKFVNCTFHSLNPIFSIHNRARAGYEGPEFENCEFRVPPAGSGRYVYF